MNVASPTRFMRRICGAALLLLGCPLQADILISEFVADNQVMRYPGSIPYVDENGSHSDWLEIWNNGTEDVSLNGWYLSDDPTNLRKWQFPTGSPSVSVPAGGRLRVWASGKDRRFDAAKLHTNFSLAKEAGSYLAIVQPDGLTISHAYNSYPQQVQDIAYGLATETTWQTLVAENATGKARVPLSAADMGSGWNSDPNFDTSSWQTGRSGFGYDTAGTYGALIGPGGDLEAAMHNSATNTPINTTALIRYAFNIDDPAAYAAVRLNIKYDDGFNCYLNGTLIQASFAGGTSWNSAAQVNRNGDLTNTFATFDPANGQNALATGTNVLAIQLLNHTTEDTDDQGTANGWRALAVPVLEGNVLGDSFSEAYLASPTPGATNAPPLSSLGPLISNTTDQVPRPAGGAGSKPIIITAKVIPSLNPLADMDPVMLMYRVMFSGEQRVPMKDDGVLPDAAAGDNIYTAEMPTAGVNPGLMLRWRVVATDNAGTAATDPPYRDPMDNDQYFGTVAQDNITTSQLPIMRWFLASPGASRTTNGTRCSLYYLDRFYDNVKVNLHGQSSSGFPVDKKSHNFNFNEDNRFLSKQGASRQRGVDLLTNYADKTKVRNTLAWEAYSNAGHIASHWCFPIRVQQNGAFWGVYDMVENGDEDFLKRCGLDSDGAFYKMYNTLDNATDGVEKKTRTYENNADLQAFINGLNTGIPITTRRIYGYDNVDIPALVNSLAVNALINNNDQGHKNYYLYRDTNGTKEWSLLPWDMDLSVGHTWQSVPNYFDDDIDSQRSIRNGVTNRLKSFCYDADEINRMFARRMRSLMDEVYVAGSVPPGTEPSPMKTRIDELVNSIDPPGANFPTDGDLDLLRWGFWTDNSGNSISGAGQDAATHPHGVRMQAARLIDSNPIPPYPGSANNPDQGSNTTFPFLQGRRAFLYGPANRTGAVSMPPAQPPVPTGLSISDVDFNPASGNVDEEFIVIKNSSADYVDVSGWTLSGEVDFTFYGGTVIPPFTTGVDNIGLLHVARRPDSFRQRAISPKGGEKRLVAGPYNGRLSARGGTIELRNRAGDLVTSLNYTGSPTETQNFLRVTELNYAPLGPSPAESAALPGVQASDFEFIELLNTGTSALNLSGAMFDRGLAFTFPSGTSLAGGTRIVLVSNQAAFQLRYGAGVTISGVYEGRLDNSGEEIRLVDSAGEVVLDFTYDPAWYGLDGTLGYSLVTRADATQYDAFGNPLSWQISSTVKGTPAAPDTGEPAQSFEGWKHSHFTPTEQTAGLGDPTADADGDLDTNFYEYSYGTNPRLADIHRIAESITVDDGGQTYAAIRYVRARKAIDVTFIVEGADPTLNPPAWSPLTKQVDPIVDFGGGLDQVTVRDDQPLGKSGPRIFRVRAVK